MPKINWLVPATLSTVGSAVEDVLICQKIPSVSSVPTDKVVEACLFSIAKVFASFVVDLICTSPPETESRAYGDVVPNPEKPVEPAKVNAGSPALPNTTVEDANSPPVSVIAV